MDIINQLIANHDADPTGTAATLKALEPQSIEPRYLSSYSWLLNHVLGELTGEWNSAFARQQKIMKGEDIPKGIYLDYAVSALYSGHPLHAWEAQGRYVAITGDSEVDVALLIKLMTLQYSSVEESKSESFLAVLKYIVDQTHDWAGSSALAGSLASAFNNIVSHWLEQPVVASAPVNDVMEAAAARTQCLWAVGGGNWMNAERACYLRALVANHLSHWEAARDVAKEGIAIIESEGDEVVDHACLLLELSRAYGGLAQHEWQQASLDEAIALSDTFAQKFPDEPGLKAWFEGLIKKQENS